MNRDPEVPVGALGGWECGNGPVMLTRLLGNRREGAVGVHEFVCGGCVGRRVSVTRLRWCRTRAPTGPEPSLAE